jgi:GNAT superfamily N-acetyltransferase
VQVGDTVSLRVISDAGPTEVVGTVVSARPGRVTVRRRDGSMAELDVTSITHSRVVPPGPARVVSTPDLVRIEDLGWRPLETEELGEWRLRAAHGFTRRANSALVLGNPGLPLGAAVERVAQWYDARGLTPRVQLPERLAPASLPAVLGERGWVPSEPVHVMTADLGPLLRTAANDGTPGAEVRLDDEPDEAWLQAYRYAGTELPPRAVELLTNHPSVLFASVRDGASCAAIARVCVDERWAGVFAVEVAEPYRRRGLARLVSTEALRWAVSRGARRAYLQTSSYNAPAIALYQSLGFAVHHDYLYWQPA